MQAENIFNPKANMLTTPINYQPTIYDEIENIAEETDELEYDISSSTTIIHNITSSPTIIHNITSSPTIIHNIPNTNKSDSFFDSDEEVTRDNNLNLSITNEVLDEVIDSIDNSSVCSVQHYKME